MKIILNIFYLIIIFLIIGISQEDPISINVEPKSGIINKNVDKNNFSFDIDCKVNKNITNKISKLKIELSVIIGEQEKKAICFLLPVRVYIESTSTTKLSCTINLESNHNINEEINLKYKDNSIIQLDNLDNSVYFNFDNFNKISETIIIGDLTLKYLDEDEKYCSNNHFLFEIINSGQIVPLQSTICTIKLSDDIAHTEANCAIPFKSNKLKCYIDVSQKKYVQNDSKNKLVIKEDCGEIINNEINYIYFSKLLLLFLLFMIL